MFRSLKDRRKKKEEREKHQRYVCHCDYCRQLRKRRLEKELADEPIKEFKSALQTKMDNS